MDFKISDTNSGKKSKACYTMVIVIEFILYSDFHLPFSEQGATDIEFNAG